MQSTSSYIVESIAARLKFNSATSSNLMQPRTKFMNSVRFHSFGVVPAKQSVRPLN